MSERFWAATLPDECKCRARNYSDTGGWDVTLNDACPVHGTEPETPSLAGRVCYRLGHGTIPAARFVEHGAVGPVPACDDCAAELEASRRPA